MNIVFSAASGYRGLLRIGLGLCLTLPAIQVAGANWDVLRIVEQVCLKDGLAHASAKYCASCRAKGGSATRWTYQLMCDGQSKAVIAVSTLDCATRPGSSSEQKRQHQENVTKELPGAMTPCDASAAVAPLFI